MQNMAEITPDTFREELEQGYHILGRGLHWLIGVEGRGRLARKWAGRPRPLS